MNAQKVSNKARMFQPDFYNAVAMWSTADYFYLLHLGMDRHRTESRQIGQIINHIRNYYLVLISDIS